MLICSKNDQYANTVDPVQKKLVSSALRYMAHINGADLIFTSVKEKDTASVYRALLSYKVFGEGSIGNT